MQALLSEVDSFVRSGIQNPVDALLVKDEVSEAVIEQKAFEARYRAALVKLEALIGKQEASLSCPMPMTLSEDSVSVFAPGTSPYLLIGQSQVKVAQETVSQKKSENYPIVNAMGGMNAGLSGTRYLSPNHDYALGVGIDLPIFEGYRDRKSVV